LLVLSAVSVRTGQLELGIQHAADALSAEPFDEIACQSLMRAHAAAGKSRRSPPRLRELP
jgi:hypothetical protein